MRTDNEYDRFPIAKRGYDPHAVEAFLDVAAADNDRMLNEAAARIAALESDLEEAKRQEEAVHLTILAATKAKEDMLEAAKHQAAELTANGLKEGDRIVTDARMQAFQLVTGARTEAELVVSEARTEAAAIARVDGEAATSLDGPTEREAALQQRIDEMQQVVAAMEAELKSRPTVAETAAAVEPAVVEETSGQATTSDEELPTPGAALDEHDEGINIVVTDTPLIEEPSELAHDDTEISVDDVAVTVEASTGSTESEDSGVRDSSITDARTPEAVRRSFYSRRSARLPRIGAEGGRDTMAAMAGLRTNFVAADAAADPDPEDKPAFEAV
jgi:DivIVA domain-containing protein